MDISNTIDEQLIAAMAIATQPPAIIRPYFDPDRSLKTLNEEMATDYAASSKEFDAWVKQGIEIRSKFGQIFQEHSKYIAQSHIELLRQFARVLEKKAENNVIDLKRKEKKMKQLSSQFSDVVGKVDAKPVETNLYAAFTQWRQEIDAYLDMALFFRALAGKENPDRRIEFVAQTSQDIDTYFASLGIS